MKSYCVIGAGFCGLGIAKTLSEQGFTFDVYEKNESIGGNWLNGVYDSTHIISPKNGTEFPDFPMPDSYPTFPTRNQILTYLNSYADTFDLQQFIRFNCEVKEIKPRNYSNGKEGWRVHLANGETHDYTGVIVANGHHWDKKIPYYPGTFAGKVLHSKDYKNAHDLKGKRVLVVGAGNSGCDIAVEAGNTPGITSFISMRRGYYFLPKTFFGIPLAEFDRPWLPVFAQKKILKLLLAITHGPNSRYGLPEPDHDLFDHHPIINSQLLYSIRHGHVRPKPDVLEFNNHRVKFVDGSEEEIDTVIWATGFKASFPFLDAKLMEWENGIPKRVGGVLVPTLANLYLFGVAQPRGGAGPLIHAGAKLLAELLRTQELTPEPLANLIMKYKAPDTRIAYGTSEILREIALGRLLLRWLRFQLTAKNLGYKHTLARLNS